MANTQPINSSAPPLPRRDFWLIVFSLSVITLFCWLYLVGSAHKMDSMDMMQMPIWNLNYFLMMFLMWAVMMVAMMVPSAAPMILIYASVARKAAGEGAPIAATSFFISGYLIAWTVFSLFATLAQWGLDEAALLSPMMVSKSPVFGALVLIAAGIYQWLPVKDACLTHCRSPFHFISSHWHDGNFGALRMGLEHGLFCIGCCWALMALLFVGGVMNLLCIALIAIFVLLEKVLPFGVLGGRLTGFALIVTGVYIFLGPLL